MTRTTTKTKQFRGQLEEQRGRLQALLEDLTGDRPEGNWSGMLAQPGDLVDAASTRSTQEDVEALIASTRQRLELVEDALGRLDDGTYGLCGACGGRISDARLEALPFTTVCVDDVHG